jgi:hypothetical protein
MKIRRILPVVILAVGSLFLLSGCDALLDAIFQNNQILVDVRIYGGRFPLDWSEAYNYGLNSGLVTLYLTDTNTGVTTTTSGYWSSADIYYVHYAFNFTGLKNDVYEITAYYTSYYDHFIDPPISVFVTPHDSPGHSADVTITF